MASIVERSSEGIVYKAAERRDVPNLDVLTFLFESKHGGAKDDTVLHVDAADPSRSVTKSQLRQLVKRTAHALRTRYGIGRDGHSRDVVMGISTGHYHLPTIFHATVAAGGIFSASSPASTVAELAGQLGQVEAKLLFCNDDTRDVAVEAARSVGLSADRVLVFGHADGGFSLREAATGKAVPIPSRLLEWERIMDRDTLDNSIVCILFSSGTTGRPKGVRLSHANLVAAACLVIGPTREWYAANLPRYKSRTLAHLPVAHIAGIQGYLVNPFFFGGTVFWMARFDFARFLEYSRRHAITGFFSVPPVYLLIAKSPLVTDQFAALEGAATGAAPMGKELQQAAQRRLGGGAARLGQTWGLSETTGSITAMPKGTSDDTGSVGMLVANHAARIVDDGGRDVEPGQPGEIWVRGPVVTKGYFKNFEADRSAFVDGWFCTGDVGTFKNGQFYIVDRKKELIKYKGEQVAPAELEALLLTHPKILDAAVIGIEGEGTEVPRAYVVADKKQISAQEIVRWHDKQVAGFKKLRGGVIFLDAIPKSPAGKILRKNLREMVETERQSKL